MFRRIFRKILPILLIAGVIYIFFKGLGGEEEEEECRAGMGNRIFEFVTLIGLSLKYQRAPTISNSVTMASLRHISKWFPNIDAHLNAFQQRTCPSMNTSIFHFNWGIGCCIMDHRRMKALENATKNTGIILQTSQGIGYVNLLPPCYVKKLLQASESVVDAATNDLFAPVWLRKYKRNLCMHLRNGDFHQSVDVFPADMAFTRAATEYILSKAEWLPVDIYIFGNDAKFNGEVLAGWKNVYVATVDASRPTNTEWEFSRLFCDIFQSPTSASTYGWWAAHLSRGQQIYYNANYSNPKRGIARQLNQVEYWPAHWIALNYTRQKTIVEVKMF